MDKKISNTEIMERYANLPADLKEALFSQAVSDAITRAGKNFGLTLDKVGELGDETGLVMLGITPPSDYVKNLADRLGVAQEKARAIAEEINQKIFQPVRESLKKVHGMGGEKPFPAREDIRKQEIKPEAIIPVPKPPKTSPTIKSQGLGIERLPSKEEVESYIKEAKAEIAVKPDVPPKAAASPIFVKNMPAPATGAGKQPIAPTAPEISPQPEKLPVDSLAAKSELEKALNQTSAAKPPQTYQGRDPYKEPIE